jgi:hypothetical protein
MAAISVTFQGESWDEIYRLIAACPTVGPAVVISNPGPSTTAASGTPQAPPATSPPPSAFSNAERVRSVLDHVNGEKSKHLLLRLAALGVRDESLTLTPALVEEFGVTSGTAFSGMIGPVNRRAEKKLGRLLIAYPSPDRKVRVWRLSPEDAQVVLDYYSE